MTTNLTTMESLALPQDLYWEGKMEPISPPNDELFAIYEDLGDWQAAEDNFANDITIISCDDLELKHHDVDLVEGLIDSEDLIIEYYDLKEEDYAKEVIRVRNSRQNEWNGIRRSENEKNFYSSSQLLDNSIESTVIANPNQVIKVETPININHFGFANLNASSILTQLTPPSSPPQTVAPSPVPPSPVLQTVTANLPIDINNVLHENHTTSEPASPILQVQQHFGFTNWQSQHHSTTDESAAEDIVFHTQIIDDILKSAADEIFEESESQSSLSAPSQGEYSTTDDEWLPSSGSCSPLQNVSTESHNDVSSGSPSASSSKKRTRPYGRGVEDRKIRKKEQNKNAATRYRQKKKLEMEHILVEELELSKRHEELRSQLAERKREAKYLKTLIREFYQKKKL